MSSFCLCYISLSYFGVYLLKNGADRHHNPARLTIASNHLWGSLRQWRDFTMIGVCSFYPFGVVIWQDVSNMSCKAGFAFYALQIYTKILNYRNF